MNILHRGLNSECFLVVHHESKNKTPNFCPYLHQILNDFQHSFTITFSRKFAIKRSLQIPPHLKGVATLPCEILVSKNCTDWKHSSSRPSAHALLRNVTVVDQLLLSNYDRKKIYHSARHTAPSVDVQIIFFTAILVWSVQRDACWRTEDWSKLPCEIYQLKTVDEWCYLHLVQWWKLFTLAEPKNSQNDQL